MDTPYYLGDGVYACVEDGMIKLTTSDGVNTIYLELRVFHSLTEYVARVFYAMQGNNHDV